MNQPPPSPALAAASGAVWGGRTGLVVAGLVLVATGGHFFNPWLGIWLAALGCVTAWKPWLGVSLLFATISVDLARPVFGGVFVSFSELALAVAILGWLFAETGRSQAWNWGPLFWGLPYSAAVLLSALANNEAYRIIPHCLRASELMAALFLAANALDRGRERDKFRWALAASAIFYSAVGLLQFPSAVGFRAKSFFDNPNQFAGYLSLLLPVIVAWLLDSSLMGRLAWGALLVTTVAADMAAQSRAAVFGAAVACLLVWGLYRERTWTGLRFQSLGGLARLGREVLAALAVTIAVTAGVATTLFFTEPNVVKGAWKLLIAREGVTLREAFLRVGWAIWRDHFWVGVGPGNYAEAVDAYPDLVNGVTAGLPEHSGFGHGIHLHVHCLYLQLGVNFGIIGLAAFLFLIGRLLVEYWKRRAESVWHVAGLGVLTAFLLHNLADVTFPSLALETGLLLGVLLPGRRPDSRVPTH